MNDKLRVMLCIILTFGVWCTTGCTDQPTPIVAAKKVAEADVGSMEIAEGQAPEKSEPEAQAIVAAALAAHTDGKPETLAGWKSFTLVRQGPVRTPTREIINQKWTIDATWPHGYKLQADLGGNSVVVAVFDTVVKRTMNLGGQRTPVETLDQIDADDFRLDTAGEWVWSLYPLTLPDMKFMSYPSTKFREKSLVGVRLYHPNLLPTVAYFDPDTKLLVGVAYQGRESGEKTFKESYALEYKTFDGMKFPVRSVVSANKMQLAEWNVLKWTRANHPNTYFESP